MPTTRTMFNTSDLQQLLGKQAYLSVDRLRVLVTVRDSRQVFSRVDCLVMPVAGAGEQWVSVDRLSQAPAVTNQPHRRSLQAEGIQ